MAAAGARRSPTSAPVGRDAVELVTRVLVGSYESTAGAGDGGLQVFDLRPDGALKAMSRTSEPGQSASLAYAATTRTLYSVDQRKTDGRGARRGVPTVWSYRLEARSGGLTLLNQQPVPGAMPGYLSLSADESTLFTACHGAFEHVEHVTQLPDGSWVTSFDYDDSTVVAHPLLADGSLGAVGAVHLRSGHGLDPNDSPQARGHAQASPHAHCVEVDPSGRWVVVCDKGTDEVVVLDAAGLGVHSVFRMPPATGPRHIAFDPTSDLAFLTCELSSRLACLRLDPRSGTFALLDQQPTVLPGFEGLNEPAAVRVHPGGQLVYLNNRGEDSLCWWAVDDEGRLERRGAISLARSAHPGVAARSFAFDVSGTFLVVADLPADLLRTFRVDPGTGELREAGVTSVHAPAFVTVVAVPLAG